MLRLLSGAVAAFALLAAPAPAADLYGLTTGGALVRFDAAAPGTLESSRPVTGAPLRGLTALGNGALYGMTTSFGLHWLDQAGTAREQVRLNPPAGATPPASVSISEYQPFASTQHLVVTSAGQQFGYSTSRLPMTEPLSNATHVDGPPRPVLAGVADGYAIDAGRDALLTRNGDGPWSTVGPLGIDVDVPAALERAGGTMVLADGGKLHVVDTADGSTTPVGTLGGGLELTDMAPVLGPWIHHTAPHRLPGAGVLEGEPASVTVHRLGDESGAVSAEYVVEQAGPGNNPGAQATPGVDFVAERGTVSFAPGEIVKTVPIRTIDDDVVEHEAFQLRLENPTGGASTDPSNWLPIGLYDDDAEFVGEPPVSLAETPQEIQLDVMRPQDAAREPTTIELRTSGGTATRGTDFELPDRVELAAGQIATSVRLRVLDDGEVEVPETIRIDLTDPGAAGGTNPRRTMSIPLLSNDGPKGLPPVYRDLIAPGLSLARARSLRAARRIPVAFTCSEACSATAELRVSRATARRLKVPQRLGRATARGVPGVRATARLAVARRTVTRLRRARRVRATLVVIARDGAANATTRRVAVTLRR